MQRISTTVIALVGEQARACAKGLGGAANIRVELPDPAAPPLERAAAAWQAATSTQAPYLVHDADPLALVAATDQVRSRIGRLTSGRWWPDLDRVLSDVDGSFPIRYHTLGRLERLPGWRECAEGDRRDLGAQRQPGSDGQEPPLRGEC